MRTFQSSPSKALLSYLLSCKAHNKPTPILFLGAGTSLTSGCPSANGLLKHISNRLGKNFSNLNEISNTLSDRQLMLEISTDVSGRNPGIGYKFLAALISRGYFNLVLTTNWDFLLEQELRTYLSPEKINLFVRPTITDKTLSDLIRRQDKPALIRLHGDLASKAIVASKELLTFEDSLEKELRQLISERGVIFTGYSMQEIRIASLVPPSASTWYIEPFNLPENVLQQLDVHPNNVITGDDSLFDNFFESLCAGLLTSELSDRILFDETTKFNNHTEKIDEIVDKIKIGLLADTLPDTSIETEIIKLLTKSQNLVGSDRTKSCLVFIEDHSAPGGNAMFNLIMRSAPLRKVIENHPIGTAKVEGRLGSRTRERSIVDFKNIREVNWEYIENVIIIDSVSFTGSTIELTQQYIQSSFGLRPEHCVAAVLRLDDNARNRLNKYGIRTVVNETIITPRLISPWGVTRPTSPSPAQSSVNVNNPKKFDSSWFSPFDFIGYNPKPWGDVTIFSNNNFSSSRILFFERFQRTSLHYHLLRDEIFTVLDDEFLLQLWDKQILLNKQQSIRIPAGVPHRIIALDTPFRLLEVAFGLYEEEKDIYRLEDTYNRKLGWESNGLE